MVQEQSLTGQEQESPLKEDFLREDFEELAQWMHVRQSEMQAPLQKDTFRKSAGWQYWWQKRNNIAEFDSQPFNGVC